MNCSDLDWQSFGCRISGLAANIPQKYEMPCTKAAAVVVACRTSLQGTVFQPRCSSKLGGGAEKPIYVIVDRPSGKLPFGRRGCRFFLLIVLTIARKINDDFDR